MSAEVNVQYERFWNELPTGAGVAVWDSDPSTNAALAPAMVPATLRVRPSYARHRLR
jgi:hypothetical protein